MSNVATLSQGKHLAELFEMLESGQLQALFASGLLTDLRRCASEQDPTKVNRDEFQVANDDPGTILDNYGSAGSALGTHTSRSRATVFGFPGSGPISFGDGRQGEDVYRLTYAVRRG